MNKRQRARLLKLADFLETLPEKNFDMNYFEPSTLNESGDLEASETCSLRDAATEVECGTSCCVAGWAAILYRKTWPRYTNGELKIEDYSFEKFFGLHSRDSSKICFSKTLLNKKERQALGLGENAEFTAGQKAKQIRQIVVFA